MRIFSKATHQHIHKKLNVVSKNCFQWISTGPHVSHFLDLNKRDFYLWRKL
jgi:hypothetical protein